MIIEIVATRTVPTIKVTIDGSDIFLHSKYDPIREVESWVHKSEKSLISSEKIIVIGLGAGHHIKHLIEKLNPSRVQVVEFNPHFYKWFQKSAFQADLKALDNVSIQLFEELSVEEKINLFEGCHPGNVLIHESSLRLMPEQFEDIGFVLKDLLLKKKSIQSQEDKMQTNFTDNVLLHDKGILQWKQYYKNRMMLLVSAGPSLNKQLPLLKHISDNKIAIIGVVGTGVIPLVRAGITPDFIMISDAKDVITGQIAGIELPDTPLFYLSTANHLAIKQYRGSRHIVWQEGYTEAEKVAMLKREPLINTGGSVATCLLDLMVYMGPAKIGLVGQDLAYTDGMSHASSTHAQRKITEGLNLAIVPNYDKSGDVQTSRNLLSYKKWFECYVIGKENMGFYNCTEGGAYINGWNHQPLRLFIDNNV
ncbi:6-hydroxymethylpterin diphosphokinase MptE-like protein [Paenibacillus qinlingensis]|uniref:6-hydroxymethylpterin diphosphokinase MptE-like domain-containing protein n=1 Tax=Paenibacillus qinlingensis TaxID=1837343 RepID=A0ABU1P1H9_9BACL|nr:6-hydroxymethylpterin diphosphokinase MptE-like protein [Paenibacillus qinlingensis]MDR6553601.1 hypothetical protein [Paenibacillus qinlingensis]